MDGPGMTAWKWLFPGLRVKRYITLVIVGVMILSVGFVFIMGKNIPRNFYFFVTAYVRQGVFGFSMFFFGAFLVYWGIRQLNRTFLKPFFREGRGRRLVDILYADAFLSRGPKIAVIGGGTGLHSLLRGLKEFTTNLTAVVTVSDDGGSSGRLRDELHMLPPGDIRQCLAALADSETAMAELFSARFKQESSLKDHSIGNLLIAAMTEIKGDFHLAIEELSKVLAIRGRVLPSTLNSVTLCAEMEDGLIVRGESNVTRHPKSINRVFLHPAEVKGLPEAVQAILDAEVVVIGPGSLYTSIIPNLLVADIANAISRTEALVIYVCNIMTQPGETDGYSAGAHTEKLTRLLGPNVIRYVVLNDRYPTALIEKYRESGSEPVAVDEEELRRLGIKGILTDDLIQEDELVRHNPRKLSAAIMSLIYEALPAAGHPLRQADWEWIKERIAHIKAS